MLPIAQPLQPCEHIGLDGNFFLNTALVPPLMLMGATEICMPRGKQCCSDFSVHMCAFCRKVI